MADEPLIEMLAGPFFANALCLIRCTENRHGVAFGQSVREVDRPARLIEVAEQKLTVDNT